MNNTKPTLKLYHANGKGTGCALSLSLYPATCEYDGHIRAEFANQLTVGKAPALPRFDWENPIVVKLDINDLSQILQVMRGEMESVNEGRGLFHRSAAGSRIVKFSHEIVPECGYHFSVANEDGKESHIFLSSAEALGISCSIENVMHLVAFGY